MGNKEYIYVLDYSDCSIYEIIHDADEDKDIQDVVEEYGCNINTCSWMVCSNRITDIVELNKD